MQGADTVNDEFEVGFNQNFETGWYRAEIAGRFVMVGFVLCAGFGLLGRGPFSHETVRSADYRIAVDYEPIARHSTSTMVTVHVPNETASVQTVRIHLDQHFIEPMGFQTSNPPATANSVSAAGIIASFDAEPHQPDTLIRFNLSPTAVGFVPMHLEVGNERVDWTMLVAP